MLNWKIDLSLVPLFSYGIDNMRIETQAMIGFAI